MVIEKVVKRIDLLYKEIIGFFGFKWVLICWYYWFFREGIFVCVVYLNLLDILGEG